MRILNNEKYQVNKQSLLEYGFINENNIYTYIKNIINNEFQVLVEYKDNIMTSKLIEVAYQDEYLQADSKTSGEYSNNIKNEYEEILNDIIEKCFTKKVFNYNQTKQVIDYIKNKYNINLEYLWEKYDDTAIVRNNCNNKWFGIIMKINKNKLDNSTNNLIEVLDLSYYKNRVDEVIDNKSIYPGYHMNKKSWITVILDNSMNINDIYNLIDISYEISKMKK
ncbi:MAG: MmcQ/YjbR family DNA-binding protein [Bacilli bacterium]|nr:MmcQ/YjbR family DNA-binding protein [Bacilli bacterium]